MKILKNRKVTEDTNEYILFDVDKEVKCRAICSDKAAKTFGYPFVRPTDTIKYKDFKEIHFKKFIEF